MRVAIGVSFMLLVPASLNAQPRCKTGITCGNSCISASKTCRIGAPAPQPTVRDTVRPAAAAISTTTAPIVQPPAAATVRLPDPIVNVYESFAAALRDWRGHPVTVRNSSEPGAFRPPMMLAEVQASHLVILAGPTRIMVPFSSIEMAFSDGSAGDMNAAITIVIRR